MSYIDRLRQLQLTSPNGSVFTANWVSNDQSKEKNLGVFNFPNVDGSEVQDLGIKSANIPLSFSFEGEDNDLEARDFFKACDERGPWEIIHPVDGVLSLQLSSVTKKDDPVNSGNVTRFETTWIEPIKESTERTSAQLASEVEAQAAQSNLSSQAQYNENISLDQASEQIANEQAINNSIIDYNDSFGNIISLSDTIAAEVTATTTGIYDSLNQATIDALSLAGQTQQLIQFPILATNNIKSRVEAYGNYITSQLSQSPEGNTLEAKNTANVIELNCSASIIGMALSITSGDLSTRTEAISLIETLTDTFDTITEALDNIQENFESKSIDKQYFSNSSSYTDLLRLIGLTILYLLRSALDLKIEKKYTLEKPSTPIVETVKNYGTLGESDENLDFFLITNNLMGTYIRYLPAGYELVAYL